MNPLNPNLLKSRFTKRFLRSLIKIKKKNSRIPRCPREIFRRCDRVKTAAEKSLASAVGSRRAWSRALLFKIRNRALRQQQWRRRPRHALARRTSYPKVMNRRCLEKEDKGDFDKIEKLRKLVPGGEAMDLCSLLDEAAHYVMCLNTQVQVMRRIADFYSP